MTSRKTNPLLLVAALCVPAFVLASCCSGEKPAPRAQAQAQPKPQASTAVSTRVTSVEPGIAGGVIEDTTTVTVTVKSVDQATRRVTLINDTGTESTFTASPEMRNLDQLHPGDKFTATLKERLVVYVRGATNSGDAEKASESYTAAIARAPKGAKPGGVFAESYEVVATVTAIDAATHSATLQGAEGWSHTVKVRPDVDLDRYKVGDSVVIRVTESLEVASKP